MNVEMVWAVLAVAVVGGQAAVIITAGPDPPGHAEVKNMIMERARCRPGHIKQIITHEHCESEELENQVCAGSCLSYSLPRTEPQVPGIESLNFCESCQPSESHWINVTLSCMLEETSFEEVKQVQQITNCSCSTCPGFSNDNPIAYGQTGKQEVNHLISDLINSALPWAEAERQANQHGGNVPSLPPYISRFTTTATPQRVLTSVTSSTVSSTPHTVFASADTGDNSVFGELLKSDDNEVVVASDLESLVNLANIDKHVMPDFRLEDIRPFEDESDSNLLLLDEGSDGNASNEISQGLEYTMRNLNELIRGQNSLQYKKLSLNEIKSVIIKLGEPRVSGQLADTSLYPSASRDDQLVI